MSIETAIVSRRDIVSDLDVNDDGDDMKDINDGEEDDKEVGDVIVDLPYPLPHFSSASVVLTNQLLFCHLFTALWNFV